MYQRRGAHSKHYKDLLGSKSGIENDMIRNRKTLKILQLTVNQTYFNNDPLTLK